jgi:hypothetical protein
VPETEKEWLVEGVVSLLRKVWAQSELPVVEMSYKVCKFSGVAPLGVNHR